MSLLLGKTGSSIAKTTTSVSSVARSIGNAVTATNAERMTIKNLGGVDGDEEVTVHAKGPPIIYPPDISQKFTLVFRMGPYVPTQTTNVGEKNEGAFGRTWEATQTIALPIPSGLVDSPRSQWGRTGLGLFGAILQQSDKLGSSTASDLKENLLGDVGANMALRGINSMSEQVGGVISSIAGATVNPFWVKTFHGVDFKGYQFNYRFAPRNAEEAVLVKRIHNTFKQHSLPSVNGEYALTLNYPSIFKINFAMPELDEYTGMFKNKFAILSGIRSDFSPSGVAFTVGNGEIVPSVSHLSLQFEEIQIVTKEDYGGSSKNLENTLVDAGSDFVDSFGNLFGLGKD